MPISNHKTVDAKKSSKCFYKINAPDNTHSLADTNLKTKWKRMVMILMKPKPWPLQTILRKQHDSCWSVAVANTIFIFIEASIATISTHFKSSLFLLYSFFFLSSHSSSIALYCLVDSVRNFFFSSSKKALWTYSRVSINCSVSLTFGGWRFFVMGVVVQSQWWFIIFQTSWHA